MTERECNVAAGYTVRDNGATSVLLKLFDNMKEKKSRGTTAHNITSSSNYTDGEPNHVRI